MTGLFIKIEGIENALSVEFYIERDNSIKIYKENLTKVFRGDKIEYYAYVDADKLGRGHLMCRAEFLDRENAYTSRPVVVTGFTGYTIPCMGEGKSISCGGYEITFTRVSDIPKSDAVIYYGVTTDDFDRIDMRELTGVKEIEEFELAFNAGEKIVVLIPYDRDENAYKDNGFGDGMPFSENVMGKNGEVATMDDGMEYKVFGEFMTIDGTIKIYIE